MKIRRLYMKQSLNVITGVIRIWTSALLYQSEACQLRANELKANQTIYPVLVRSHVDIPE